MHSRGTRNQYLTVALQTTRPEEVLQKINAQSAKILPADVVGEDQRPPVLTLLLPVFLLLKFDVSLIRAARLTTRKIKYLRGQT